MNTFLNGLKETNEFTRTENGAVTRTTTHNKVLDMFAMGAAYRTRSDADCILLFSNALREDEAYALKCLFYISDCRGGQGERRFFRVCYNWLANTHPEIARRNMKYIAEYRRWDDFYCLVDTPLEKEMFAFLKKQLALDVTCKTPSLLAKWLKSENTSSPKSKELGAKTRKAFDMTARQYRKTLSILRARINVLERLMSANRWDEIEFDKIPSKAGFIYKNAFARHDIERAKKGAETYADFAKDTTKKVNAKTLYPYECVHEAMSLMRRGWNLPSLNDTNRLMVNKYWDNLADYFKGASFNGMAIVDTSGSMCGSDASAPINVAISLGMYCAKKAKGPFANHFMTFSSNPKLVEVQGVDFCDEVIRMASADWGGSTNVEAAFDLMLNTAIQKHCPQSDIPENLIIISDMEFNSCVTSGPVSYDRYSYRPSGYRPNATLFECMKVKWATHGYKLPKLIFWNVQARQDNIPMRDDGHVSYVSGMSPTIFENIMTGKTAWDLAKDKLDSERYASIH